MTELRIITPCAVGRGTPPPSAARVDCRHRHSFSHEYGWLSGDGTAERPYARR